MTIKLPTPNIPLLRRAVEWAEAEAAKPNGRGLWNQGNYAWQTDCGTAYCIAGYVVSISDVPGARQVGTAHGAVRLLVDGKQTYWDEVADSLLGLTEEEGNDLYSGSNTIGDIRRIAEQIAARAGERL